MDVAVHILLACWQTACEMAPYLLFGFLVAGLLSVFVKPETVERHLGGRGFAPVWKAALIGVPLPLCSCGVIPVAASLRRHGASRGATTAFLLSTPQTGVDSIMITYSLMGPLIGILRPVVAFVTGIIGGALVDVFVHDRVDAASAAPTNASCTDDCCASTPRRNRIVQALHYGFVTLPRDIANALLVGLVMAGLISALIPDDFFAGYFGGGFVGMLVMMAVGIPMYVCATGSVPVAAALILKGVSPGAALVFLMTGPATNAATISIIWKTMGRRTTCIYLGSLAVCSLAAGYTLDGLVAVTGVGGHAHHAAQAMSVGGFQNLCAVALFAVLAWSYVKPMRASAPQAASVAAAETMELVITGMHCSRCAESVTRALKECAGVSRAEVHLSGGRAVVAGVRLDSDALKQAVAGLGYDVKTIRTPPAQP